MTTRTCTSKTPMTTHTCTYMIMHDDHHPLNFGDDMSKKYKNISMHVMCVTVQIQCNISEKKQMRQGFIQIEMDNGQKDPESPILYSQL